MTNKNITINIITNIVTFLYAVKLHQDVSRAHISTTIYTPTDNCFFRVVHNGEMVELAGLEYRSSHFLQNLTIGDYLTIFAYKGDENTVLAIFGARVTEQGLVLEEAPKSVKNTTNTKTTRLHKKPTWA